MTSFSWQDVKGTFAHLAIRLIKPHVVLPSKTKHGELEPQMGRLDLKKSFLSDLLQNTKGILDLPSETVLKHLLQSSKPETFKDESSCMLALKVFLFNYKITIVSPETYYSGCSMTCPHEGCDHPLYFLKVNWDFPRLVLGVTAQNEIVIPLTYVCSGPGKHRYKTIDPEYLRNLPSLVQSRYNYSTNNAIVFNSRDAWSLLTHQTLEPIYRIVRNSRQFEFAERVEKYALFVDEIRRKCSDAKFPKPPKKPHEAVAGSKTSSFLHPSEKLIREIRQAAVLEFKPEIDASMKAVLPGTRIAIDSNYRNTKKTKSSSNCMTTVLAKDGKDKGKCMGYSIHTHGESHVKSAEVYKGIANRPGYDKISFCCVDKCCDGRCVSTLVEHPVKKIFGLDHAPTGDIFHAMEGISCHTRECSLSTIHMRDLSQLFFRDVSSTEEMDTEYPGWLGYFDEVNLDGTLPEATMLRLESLPISTLES